MTKSKYVPVA